MSDFTIREALDSELNTCAVVIRDSFATVAKDFELTPENCPTNGAFIESNRLIVEKQKGNSMFALCHDNIIIGFMSLEKKSRDIYELEKLAVLPRYRHRNYGRALLDFAKEQVDSWGGNKITIGIIEENIRLKDWYMQCGFKSTGQKIFPHLPFTVGFMELDVDSGL